MLFNGKKISKKELNSSFFGYVQQNDIFPQNLSVKEIFLYHSFLRLSPFTFIRTRIKKINQIIQLMGLSHIKNRKVGIPGISNGISG